MFASKRPIEFLARFLYRRKASTTTAMKAYGDAHRWWCSVSLHTFFYFLPLLASVMKICRNHVSSPNDTCVWIKNNGCLQVVARLLSSAPPKSMRNTSLFLPKRAHFIYPFHTQRKRKINKQYLCHLEKKRRKEEVSFLLLSPLFGS